MYGFQLRLLRKTILFDKFLIHILVNEIYLAPLEIVAIIEYSIRWKVIFKSVWKG